MLEKYCDFQNYYIVEHSNNTEQHGLAKPWNCCFHSKQGGSREENGKTYKRRSETNHGRTVLQPRAGADGIYFIL